MKFNIVAETYEPSEMAQVVVNRRVVFIGNFWDFHPGCYGTEITVRDNTKNPINIDLDDVWGRKCSAKTLANLIAMKLKALGHQTKVSSKERKTAIAC